MEINHENRASGEVPDSTPGISWAERTFASTRAPWIAPGGLLRPARGGRTHPAARASQRPGSLHHLRRGHADRTDRRRVVAGDVVTLARIEWYWHGGVPSAPGHASARRGPVPTTSSGASRRATGSRRLNLTTPSDVRAPTRPLSSELRELPAGQAVVRLSKRLVGLSHFALHDTAQSTVRIRLTKAVRAALAQNLSHTVVLSEQVRVDGELFRRKIGLHEHRSCTAAQR